MNKEQELRPCPLCNAVLTVEHFGAYGGPDGDWLTHPAGEHAACPIAALTFLATPEKIAAWNRRSSDEQAEVVGDQRMTIAHAILNLAIPEPVTERKMAENSGICRAANLIRDWPAALAVRDEGIREGDDGN